MKAVLKVHNESVAVLSTRIYRAESLARIFTDQCGCPASSWTPKQLPSHLEATLVIVDLDADGDSLLDCMRSMTGTDAKIIVIGVAESPQDVIRIAEAGACGYLPFTACLEQVLAVVNSVKNGEFTCSPEITYALFKHLNFLSQRISLARPKTLTSRERKVLALLAESLTNKEIATRLLISEYTAKNHIHHLLKKLGVKNRILASATIQARQFRRSKEAEDLPIGYQRVQEY